MQAKHRTDVLSAAHFELAQAAPLLLLRRRLRLDPAKHLLDAAAGVDRLGVALVASGAAIDGGATRAAGVLRDVWRHCNAAHLRDKALGVVVLVGPQGFLVGTGDVSRHRFGGIPLPGAHRLCDAAVDDQSMAVVHEHMAPVARFGRVGIGLAGQHRVRIAAGAVGLVAELDASEIPFGSLLAGLWSAKTLARA